MSSTRMKDYRVIKTNAWFVDKDESAPNLTRIVGVANFIRWKGSAPKLKEIETGWGIAGWSGTAPKLNKIVGRDFQWAKFWKP